MTPPGTSAYPRRAIVSALVAFVGLVLAVVPQKPAIAAGGVHAEVRVILASKRDAGAFLDPKLEGMPSLKSAPFERYNAFEQLSVSTVMLSATVATAHPLVNGRTLTLTLLGNAEGGRDEHGHRRYLVRAQMGDHREDDVLKRLDVSASEHEPFFVAGQPYKGGVLLIAITITP